MVGPCWVAEIDGGLARVEFREEEGAEMYSSCAGDGLDAACALFGESWRVGA